MQAAKSRAKKAGIPFDLDFEDILPLHKHCPALGIPVRLDRDKIHDGSPSLDRVIPALGYVKGNAIVISHRANRIKTNASWQEIEAVADWLRKILDERTGIE